MMDFSSAVRDLDLMYRAFAARDLTDQATSALVAIEALADPAALRGYRVAARVIAGEPVAVACIAEGLVLPST
jgi:hypothetical protein